MLIPKYKCKLLQFLVVTMQIVIVIGESEDGDDVDRRAQIIDCLAASQHSRWC